MVDDSQISDSNELETGVSEDTDLADGFDQESFDATQNLIIRLGDQLDELNDTAREYRERLQNIFDNDETMSQAKETADEAKQVLKQRKSQLEDTQEVKEIKAKMADLKEDKKMVEESLQNHLLNYFQMTGGSTTVDLPDGDEREFSLKAKLKRKKS